MNDRIPYVLIALFLMAVASACGSEDFVEKFEDFYHQRLLERLSGIQQTSINVFLNDEAEAFRVGACGVSATCDSMLRSAGIAIVTLDESFDRLKKGPPFDPVGSVRIRIQVLMAQALSEESMEVFFAVDVDFAQEVMLSRDTSVGLNAQTWNVGMVGSSTREDLCHRVLSAVRAGVSDFLELYREANP